MQETSPKFFAFVLMPIAKEFDDIYAFGIKDACKAAGCYCERVDEQIFSEGILERIYNQISKADVIIADMTGQNLNVFYETGYAHALNKKVILVTKDAGDIPFDLKHYTHIIYGNSIGCLKEELTKRIEYFVNNPGASRTDKSTFIIPYIDDAPVKDGKVIKVFRRGDKYHFARLNFHNPPHRMIDTTLLRYNVICGRNVKFMINSIKSNPLSSVDIPNDKRILNIPLPNLFLPNQWHSIIIYFEHTLQVSPDKVIRFPVTLQTMSETTCRDIDFEMEAVTDKRD